MIDQVATMRSKRVFITLVISEKVQYVVSDFADSCGLLLLLLLRVSALFMPKPT
jgi:hypothetical protein